MQLVYFSGRGNFGDELNHVLWPHFAPELFVQADRTGFLGIGTIIGMPVSSCDVLHVFSSGIGYDRLGEWSAPHRIWCVRGPLTARLLGAPADATLTDGAILTPWMLPGDEAAPPARTVGVMPHWESLRYPGWQEACAMAGFTLISPVGDPETVVRALRATRLVLTESLHGAIIADGYGIPWAPIQTSGNFSVFKWMDWCLSMDVPLKVAMVPPPSLDALVRFGRPRQGTWGDHVTFTVDDAIAEFERRTAITSTRPAARGLRQRAVWLLRPGLLRSGPARRLAGLATGYAPARTAAHLVRAAIAPVTPSPAAMAELLRERMLERLRALCRTAQRPPAA